MSRRSVNVNAQPPLLFERDHDLPVRWDDTPIVWSPWEEQEWSTLDLHLRAKDRWRCDQCRSETKPVRATGNGDGIWLVAFRCPDCRHDQVLDMGSDTWWDLDPSDYGPAGSVNA